MGLRGAPWILATILLASPAGTAEKVTEFDRFRLENDCKPMQLMVDGLPSQATTIGLTKNVIEVAVRSRLRAARLYSEDRNRGAWSSLHVDVNVIGAAFNVNVQYTKPMKDMATNFIFASVAWYDGATGTHGRNGDYVLATVSLYVDKFIDEYLRVNAESCK